VRKRRRRSCKHQKDASISITRRIPDHARKEAAKTGQEGGERLDWLLPAQERSEELLSNSPVLRDQLTRLHLTSLKGPPGTATVAHVAAPIASSTRAIVPITEGPAEVESCPPWVLPTLGSVGGSDQADEHGGDTENEEKTAESRKNRCAHSALRPAESSSLTIRGTDLVPRIRITR
jgi:hypothetical protein